MITNDMSFVSDAAAGGVESGWKPYTHGEAHAELLWDMKKGKQDTSAMKHKDNVLNRTIE